MEVLEHTHGRPRVRHEGEIIPSRPAPPRPGVLRAAHGGLAPNPEISHIVKRPGNHRLNQPQLWNLANLEPDPVVEEPAVEKNHSEPPARREPTPRQLVLWKATQQAEIQGLGLREIARQFGISRNTVGKYARSLTPPIHRPPNRGPRPSPHQPAGHRD